MDKLIVVIATKNRPELFAKSIESVVQQIKKADEILVVSDSIYKNYEIENDICTKIDCTLLKDCFSHNYAGSLNTALDYIIKKYYIDKNINPSKILLAFLDDDDTWDSSYLLKCFKAIGRNNDFVISGLFYTTDKKSFPLSIPTCINKKSFLSVNPHIQGSNTFIRMNKILEAGGFDENMDSTTDRDIFTRVLMLTNKYSIVNEHLVHIDAKDSRLRLTNTFLGKRESLSKFYSKYGGLMNQDEEITFFERTKRYSEINKDEVEKVLSYTPSFNINLYKKGELKEKVIIGFVASSSHLCERLIKDINEYGFNNYEVLLIKNFSESLSYSSEKVKTIQIEEIRENINDHIYGDFITMECINKNTISNIACARSILQYHLYENSVDGDIIWILDDDMEPFELINDGVNLKKTKSDFFGIANKYKTKVDVLIGSYSLDAPLPTFSTIRTSLLDFTYRNKLNKNKYYCENVRYCSDYYYDLSENSNVHLETPLPFNKNCSIDDVFSGKATSRPLFVTDFFEKDPFSRGGNTIVFNRNVLKIPNISLQFGNIYARRSDYFWTLLVKKYGYKIKQISFSTLHNKEKKNFDYEEEVNKELCDLIGSSFTKAYKAMKGTTKTEFYTLFNYFYIKRLVRFIDSYYRIMGLLKINNDTKYSTNINEDNLLYLINKFKEKLERSLIESSFDNLNSFIISYDNSLKVKFIKKELENNYNLNCLEYLGRGNEGVVFKSEGTVYKYFYSKKKMKFLENIATSFYGCPQLENLTFHSLNEHPLISYFQDISYEPYLSGHSLELANLLSFLKIKNLVLTNIKKENFVLLDNKLKFIDYGKNICQYSDDLFNTSVERAFQMLKYPEISTAEYKQIISLSYMKMTNEINFGIENFKNLVEHRYKEQLHDSSVISEIKELNPLTILDYGAGKCKIANSLSDTYKVSVYDIDLKTICNKANKNVRIIHDLSLDSNKYDLVNCNLVLCCTDDNMNDDIINNIYNKLNKDGILIISICNPFFNYVQHTELRDTALQGQYDIAEKFNKNTPFGVRNEFHRPFEYYENLLQKNGFKITKIVETDGVNTDTLNKISEQLILTCKKVKKHKLEDVSLMIKTNIKECNVIYNEIKHIVLQLEKGVSFFERVVIVDDQNIGMGKTLYNENLIKLKIELNRSLKNKLIDRVIYSSEADSSEVYNKFFSSRCSETHSKNGQQLLATLYGFLSIKTKYVYQTDSDIIFFNNWKTNIHHLLNILKENDDFSVSMSIYKDNNDAISYGDRTEVRNCLINLEKLYNELPLNNPINDDQYFLPWHRCIDQTKLIDLNIRLSSSNLFFIHPENEIKKNKNLLSIVKNFIEDDKVFIGQKNYVNLVGKMDDWIDKTKTEMIIFIRGRNTNPEKIKRLFDSLKRQTKQDFQIIYVDDDSTSQDKEYAKLIFKYDTYFKDKVIGIFNSERNGSLKNEETFLSLCVKNFQSIIVNIDNDDCLLYDDALDIIQLQFDRGADVTIGNCFRTDKPLKKYKILSFKNICQRNGDNIWLHPKCFRRYLFNYAIPYLKKNGNYIDVCTDYAMMLPIIRKATYPIFIDKQIYYFEPSKENKEKEGKYMISINMKEYLLQKQKEEEKIITIAIIGDSNISIDSNQYIFAYNLGKALVDEEYKIQSGGLGGVMEAVFKGAHDSKKYKEGYTIGILPSNNEHECNPYCDIVIPTGLDIVRNGIVIDADAVIAIGGGAGTLSEMAMAWEKYKLIIGVTGFGGWSEKLAGHKIDKRDRYENIKNDSVFKANTISDIMDLLKENLNIYTREYNGIKYRQK